MLNFLTLTLTPTALIGLDKNLKVPKSFKCISNSKPSTYQYPEFIKIDKDKKKEKVTTAVLSTTTKAKARKDRKEGKTGVDADPTPVNKDAKMDGEEEKKEEEKKEEEPSFQELKNPTRVLKQQETKISYTSDSRYKPVLESRYGGFVILREIKPL
jgi:26S proteasome regulatory subunit N2